MCSAEVQVDEWTETCLLSGPQSGWAEVGGAAAEVTFSLKVCVNLYTLKYSEIYRDAQRAP